MVLQTSNPRLSERALQDNVSYDTLTNLGVSKEQYVSSATKLEKASGQFSQQSQSQVKVEEKVRKLDPVHDVAIKVAMARNAQQTKRNVANVVSKIILQKFASARRRPLLVKFQVLKNLILMMSHLAG